MNIKQIKAEDTWKIRHKVMWPDKDINYVKLKNDNKGIHYGLYEQENIVAVISLFIYENSVQFRKFATLKEMQGKGYGSKLLNHVIRRVQELNINYIYCNARKNKVKFYKKFGLKETNKTFKKGNIDYVIMGKNIE